MVSSNLDGSTTGGVRQMQAMMDQKSTQTDLLAARALDIIHLRAEDIWLSLLLAARRACAILRTAKLSGHGLGTILRISVDSTCKLGRRFKTFASGSLRQICIIHMVWHTETPLLRTCSVKSILHCVIGTDRSLRRCECHHLLAVVIHRLMWHSTLTRLEAPYPKGTLLPRLNLCLACLAFPEPHHQ